MSGAKVASWVLLSIVVSASRVVILHVSMFCSVEDNRFSLLKWLSEVDALSAAFSARVVVVEGEPNLERFSPMSRCETQTESLTPFMVDKGCSLIYHCV